MSGQIESIKIQIEKFERELDGFEQSLGLTAPNSPLSSSKISEYLSLTEEQIEKLYPEECATIAYLLFEYSMFIRRKFSRNKARIFWSENKIKELIANETPKYSGSWQSQEQQAINANDVALILQKSMIKAKMLNISIEHTADCVEQMAKQLQNVQFSKKR